MGNCTGLFRRRMNRRHIVLILIGLDNAGKTQTVNSLSGENDINVLPTVGFKAVNLIHKYTPVTIYDLGGGPQFRQIWSQYYSEVHGVIFVIDSSDFSRLDECKVVLEEVLSHDKISGKPVLVLANKQDKTGALDDIDMVEKLNIEPLVNRYRCPTLVESYTANFDTKSKKVKIDSGLKKGYQWLLNYIIRRYGDINLRVQTDIHADLERRKRLCKAYTRGSQTCSDDIATHTGFENPNFTMSRSSEREKEERVITVKAAKATSSIDTTITIDSVGDTETTSNPKPKLSPLFGNSNSTITTTKVELEPRMQVRKLSPFVKNINNTNEFFKNKPQSSPSTLKNVKMESESPTSTIFDSKTRDAAYTEDRKHRVLISDQELALMSREVVLTERDYTSKSATLELGMQGLAGAPRPSSASQLVRRQLELGTPHKRRLSLRYIHRNKTSPECLSMMLYPQGKAQRHLDKGDFEQASTIN